MTKTTHETEKEIDEFSRDTNRKILKIDKWETPCSHYPLAGYGVYGVTPLVQIRRKRRNKGLIYPMENVDGYGYWSNIKPIRITSLEINGRCWMTDEPINWIGMQRFAEAARGNVFVAGLGLGMICHALAKNDAVAQVTVLERDPNVIRIIGPYVKYPKIRIMEGDFWNSPVANPVDFREGKIVVNRVDYNTIILDIWVWGNPTEAKKSLPEIEKALSFCRVAAPQAKTFVWGLTDPLYNPAIADPE